jgi:hypothetical protein
VNPPPKLDAPLAFAIALMALLVSCGGKAPLDSRYPPLSKGCDVKLFHTRVEGMKFDDIGRVDAICTTDIAYDDCLVELKNQACKLGGDIVYDVPEEPNHPSPDKVRFTGHVAHSRAAK